MKSKPHTPGLAADVETAIIGAGFAGLGMAVQLQRAGLDDFVILEAAGEVGGTWRDNHYPGCACDVQSHLYSFSFALNPDWSRMFSPQPEILAYLRGIAEQYGLRPRIRFNSALAEAHWDEGAGRWRLKTADGQRFTARVLVSGMGGLSRPAYPQGIHGLENFRGRTFHSQQWDHGFEVAGQRIAVIGTGASAIQFVPQLQKTAARVDLYQRTPPWIMPKPDRPVSRFERWLFRALPFTQRLLRGAIYAALESRVVAFVLHPGLMKLVQKVSLHHLRKQVSDPMLRQQLTPDYTIGCKRVLISNDYYPALTQPNVALITAGIREVRAHSIVDAAGVEREVDAIVFGTGFKAVDPIPAGMIFGREGRDITACWQSGPEAYKGTTVAGFPNLFLLAGPNTGLGHSSMVYMIESQIAYVVDALRTLRAQRLASLDVRDEVQADHNRDLQARMDHTVWTQGGCRSWYQHPSGRNTALWPGFTWQYRRALRRFDLAAYRATPQAVTATAEKVE
jgi:cation diffusion facilitator CzcD-associated flavoprotein CzcO